MINVKVHQVIAVANLDEVRNWENMKKISWWVNVDFEEHNKAQKTKHFGFSFKTKNIKNLLYFNLYLIESKNKEIEFIRGEKKISILNFTIEIWK